MLENKTDRWNRNRSLILYSYYIIKFILDQVKYSGKVEGVVEYWKLILKIKMEIVLPVL